MNHSKEFVRAKWRMLFALMFCYFFYYCGRQNFGFAILGIQQTLHLTTTDTGLISAGLLLAYGIGQAVSGSVGDKYGARKLLTFGALLSVLFNVIASFATGFWSLLIPWCLNGYVQSLGFAPGSKLITEWWDKSERGKAFGLYLSASGVASIVAFAVCIYVLRYFDWPWLFRIPVIFLFVSAIIFYCVARDKPEDLGFPPIENTVQDKHSDLTTQERYRLVFTHYRFQLASLSMGFCSVARYGLLIWVPVIYLGKDSSHSSWMTIALPMGMALGTIAAGSLSDKLFNSDRIKPAILFMTLAAMLTIVLYFMPVEHVLLAMILLFFIGFFVFGAQSALFALCPELLGNACAGTGTGIMNAYGYAFSAVGEALIGYLIHYTHDVSITFVVVAVSCVLSVVTAYFVMPKKVSKVKYVFSKESI
jgi:OPA family glycerol-3-phosphate transporter-like MFS transporter